MRQSVRGRSDAHILRRDLVPGPGAGRCSPWPWPAGCWAASFLLGRRVRNRVKDLPYECGIVPTGNARERFSVRFYLVAMLFILFDIEAIFLYPWAVVYRELKMFAFVEMLIFIVLILSGFFYIWKKGALDWSASGPLRPRKRSAGCYPKICKNTPSAAAVEAFDSAAVAGAAVRPRRADARDRPGAHRRASAAS